MRKDETTDAPKPIDPTPEQLDEARREVRQRYELAARMDRFNITIQRFGIAKILQMEQAPTRSEFRAMAACFQYLADTDGNAQFNEAMVEEIELGLHEEDIRAEALEIADKRAKDWEIQ